MTVNGTTTAVGFSANAAGFTNAGTINAGTGAAAINAGPNNLTTGAISTTGNVLLIADAMNVNGVINAASTTINPYTGTTLVTLGAGATGLGLTNAEIGNIAGALTISGSNVTVDGPVSATTTSFSIAASTLTVNNNLVNTGAVSLAAASININGATVQGSSATLNASTIALTGTPTAPAAVIATTGNVALTASSIAFVADAGGNGAYVAALLGAGLLTTDSCVGCATLATNPAVTGTNVVGGYALLGMTITGYTANAATAVDLSGIINQSTAATNIATGGSSSTSGSGGSGGTNTAVDTPNAGAGTTGGGDLLTNSTGGGGGGNPDDFTSAVAGGGGGGGQSGQNKPPAGKPQPTPVASCTAQGTS